MALVYPSRSKDRLGVDTRLTPGCETRGNGCPILPTPESASFPG